MSWFREARPYRGVPCFICRKNNWLYRNYFNTVDAMVWGGSIYFKNRKAYRNRALRRHEYRHIEQARETWFFGIRYAVLTMWYGYWNNPYEIDARNHAGMSHERTPIEYPLVRGGMEDYISTVNKMLDLQDAVHRLTAEHHQP